ncbi:uncharacterized protein LOC134775235 [Penaeus indicus]|uniref:uncharacterized protein LOC134775235 n=1 Tax=Penaeus indicus TaxID=29960 RepID=UPI00300D04BF
MSPLCVTSTSASLEGSCVTSTVPDHALCSEDESEEQLREDPEFLHLLSPTIPRKLPTHKFSLTPKPKDVLIKEYEAEVEDEIKIDLTTPHTSVNVALDCPGRPAKGRKSSITSLGEKSCRHLFTKNMIVSDISEKIRDEDSKNVTTKAHEEEHEEEGLHVKKLLRESDLNAPVEKGYILEHGMDCSPERQAQLIKHMSLNSPLGDNIPTVITPIGSPQMGPWSSSVSSCSGCSSCVSSELESPVLLQVKAASQTIESSGEDFDVDLPLTQEALCNMPYTSSPVRESSDETEVKKHQQEEETQTKEKKDVKSFVETNSPKAESSSLPIPIPSINLKTGTHKFLSPAKDHGSLGDQFKVAKLETNITVSSFGSTSSNWTAISGISPLPSSLTNTHHHHNHHHHHHHHHHKHHHHHHHHHHHQHLSNLNQQMLDENKDILITSTPINKKIKLDVMDLSAVTTNPDQEGTLHLIPRESRFVHSSELKFIDTFNSQGSIMDMELAGEDRGLSQPSGTPLSGSDKENIPPSSALCLVSHPGPDPSTIEDENKLTAFSENCLECALPRDNVDSIPNRIFLDSPILGKDMLKRMLEDSITPTRRKRRKPIIRRLTEQEAHALIAAPETMPDDVWEDLPIIRRASSVDESLFRSVMIDGPLSTTLE